MENENLTNGQPQGNNTGTQPEKPYKTFNNKDDLTAYVNEALKNKEKRIQELEYENKKNQYSKDLNNFDSKLQDLMLTKIDFSKSDDEIKNQISSVKEEFKEFANDERNSNISFIKKDKQEKQEESFIDKIMKVDIG